MTSYLSPLVGSLIPLSFHAPIKRLLIDALSLGPLPQHVAFIMDGNRRYARQAGLQISKGHEDGFTALSGLLDFFLHLNVPNVSLYAFSIENFARPDHEVEALMHLARDKLLELAAEGKLLQTHGVRIRVLGARELLPIEVQQACTDVERLTRHNTRGTLNIHMPYTAREEIARSVRRAVASTETAGVATTDSLEADLYSSPHSPPVDLLIRTSGVNRLSDYMLWQSTGDGSDSRTGAGASICFLRKNWPDVGVADLLPVLVGWQMEQLADRWTCR